MHSVDNETGRFEGRDLIILFLTIGLLFGIMLGNRPLSVPDEGRYVEISREMAATGDYITPRLNGVKYFEKPVLFYWLESLSVKLFGIREFTLRLWPALFALFGCFSVYVAGSMLYGRRAGLLAAGVLATNVLYYALSQAIILDMPVSIFLTAALLSFILGTREEPGLRRRLFMWGFFACAALATLTKGLIGILIPGMVIGAWIVLLNEWRVLRTMYLFSGSALFLAIAVPWHVLAGRANPEFYQFYFIHEHFQRYLTKIHGRYKPAWYFIPILLLGFFPWSAFLLQAIKNSIPTWRDRQQHRETIFLLLWAGLVFLFFSASSSKLIPYILPIFPPLALLLGRYLAKGWDENRLPGSWLADVILALFALALTIGLIILPHYRPELDLQELRPHRVIIIFILIAGVLLLWLMRKRFGVRGGLLSLLVFASLFLVAVSNTMPRLDTRSIKTLATELKPRLLPGDEVVSYKTYYQDLPAYLEQRITVVDWTGELYFGTTAEDTSGWMIDDTIFWKRWRGTGTIYMMTDIKTYDTLRKNPELSFFTIASNRQNIVVCNRKATP
jgi:4-amino-4-deoxy-L-arabinose transferase-like glycosyltransferase